VPNVYFDLTRELNRFGPVAALSSGQAVVYYRLAIMSKDGDWILRDTPEACGRVLSVFDQMQQADRRRLAAYQRAAGPYLAELRRLNLATLSLDRGHAVGCRIAGPCCQNDRLRSERAWRC
jgi:hypothetical protein